MVGDIIMDRRWRDVGGDNKRRSGRGDSRCLFLGEKRSAQLQVEKLGSGCWRDIGGGGWLGGRLKGGRRGEGGENRSVQGRKASDAGLLSQFSAGRRRMVEGVEDVLTPVHIMYRMLVKDRSKWYINLPGPPFLQKT